MDWRVRWNRRALQSRSAQPPTPTLRLFRLYRDRKVLCDRHWEDFCVVDDEIRGPGSCRLRPSDFYLWGLVWQALAEADSNRYHELLKKAANS